MQDKKAKSSIRIFVAATFLIMIGVNALANILPINGVNTGQVSDSYTNLFAPAGLTFAIWGLIYLLLAIYTLYQFGFFRVSGASTDVELLNKVGVIFSVSSLANSAWIFSWHYRLIPFSMVLMLVLLVCLILINKEIKGRELSSSEKFFVALPFSVYFGWITVATIANMTTLLVSIGWRGGGLSEATWAIVVILVGMVIGITTMIKNRDFAYGLVLIWAYGGIWLKHISPDGFSGQYLSIITTIIGSIVLFIISEGYLVISRKKR